MADEWNGIEDALREHRRAEREWEVQKKELNDRVERLTHRLDQMKLRERQAELRLLKMIQRLPWGVALEDTEGRIALANRRFCDLFQLKLDSEKLHGVDLHAMERTASSLFLDPQTYLARLETIRRGREEALGDILELASGDIWHRDSVPIETPEGGLGWLHLLQDVTGERRKESELQKAKAAAEEANRSTAAFLAAMSHEMRTPLSAVLGLTELLGEELHGESRALTTRIASNAESLLRLIEDILDFVQLDEGRVRLSEGPLDPVQTVQAVADQLSLQIENKGLKVEVEVDKNLPARVLGDEARIRQLLVGLVGNSLKFTPSGSIKIRAYRPPSGTLDEICYEVEDTGIGIPREKLESVFERFYRVRDDTPGTGLGLSICRDLVQLMGGRIGIESTEGQGTCAFFILKQPALADSEPSELDNRGTSRRSVRPESNAQPYVLLVEDNEDNRVMMARFIRNAGYTVREVDNALDAQRILRDERFDALVTDISMPGMDGIELVAALREQESQKTWAPTPTIVVTAHALPEYQQRCREVGVDVFLTKPIKGAILCRALAKVTRQGASVLVVDDSPDARLLLRLCLEQYSPPLDVVVTGSGAAAVQACQLHNFSVIFLDAWMPEMTGVETLAKIREIPAHRDTPIIGVTALTDADEVENLLERGFSRVLTKPIDRRVVLRAVQDHLRAATVLSRNDPKSLLESSPTLLQLESVQTHAPHPSDTFVVHVDSDIRDLIPSFLKNRRADLESLRGLLKEGNFEEVQRIGHGMKGTGGAYGFDQITDLGGRLEQAAKERNSETVKKLTTELESFLKTVRIENAAASRLPGTKAPDEQGQS